jgi:hypothetical protein
MDEFFLGIGRTATTVWCGGASLSLLSRQIETIAIRSVNDRGDSDINAFDGFRSSYLPPLSFEILIPRSISIR